MSGYRVLAEKRNQGGNVAAVCGENRPMIGMHPPPKYLLTGRQACAVVLLCCNACAWSQSAKPPAARQADKPAANARAVAPVLVRKPLPPALRDADELFLWQAIFDEKKPSRVLALCEAFQSDFPKSQSLVEVRLAAEGAAKALEIQQRVGLSGDYFEAESGDESFERNLRRAARGDANAAFQIAQAYRGGSSGLAANRLRVQQWLRFSAELGNARASWEVAELYNADGLFGDAAHFEKRAVDLGYKPPPRLPTRGY